MKLRIQSSHCMRLLLTVLLASEMQCRASMLQWLGISQAPTEPLPTPTKPAESSRPSHQGPSAVSFEVEPHMERRLQAGRKAVRELETSSDAFMCWRDTHQYLLSKGCKRLTYDRRARIAAMLTNCHLERSGLKPLCNEKMDLKVCTKALGKDVVAFQTYNTFFSHADNICFYVSQQIFTESTERAVNVLYTSVIDTADHLTRFHASTELMQDKLKEDLLQYSQSMGNELKQLQEEEQQRFATLASASAALSEGQQDLAVGQHTLQQRVNQTTAGLSRASRSLGRQLNQSMTHLSVITREQRAMRNYIHSTLHAFRQLQNGQKNIRMQQRLSLQHELKLLGGQRAAQRRLRALQDLQRSLGSMVNRTQEDLSSLRAQQAEAFRSAQISLMELVEHSHRAEQRITSLINNVQEAVDVVVRLDTTLLGEFFQINSVFYFLAVTIAVWLLTAGRSTQAARIPCLVILVTSWALEKQLCHMYSASDRVSACGLLRQVTCVLLCITLSMSVHMYKDWAYLTYQIVRELHTAEHPGLPPPHDRESPNHTLLWAHQGWEFMSKAVESLFTFGTSVCSDIATGGEATQGEPDTTSATDSDGTKPKMSRKRTLLWSTKTAAATRPRRRRVV